MIRELVVADKGMAGAGMWVYMAIANMEVD